MAASAHTSGPDTGRMSPQRRVALVSVFAACGLVALKLGAGLASGSLGLVSEAVHSGTDLVAALLAFFSLGVAARPADRTHAYGHGKAEHLSALGEGGILVVASLIIGIEAVRRLAEGGSEVNATWWVIGVAGIVLVIDLLRTVSSMRAARRYKSAALAGSALHFAGDLAGTLAVLLGLLLVRAGHESADALAALFVSVLVLVAAGRLMRRNVDVLMDRVPADAERAARQAVERLAPHVKLRRLRMRDAAGQHFVDVVVAISPAAVLGQAHAAADAVETAIGRAVPGSDVVVHVEPEDPEAADLEERVLAAAQRVGQVREVHNVSVLRLSGANEASLHIKLPPDMELGRAHDLASRVERAVREDVPEVRAVHTHIEPLAGPLAARPVPGPDAGATADEVSRVVREVAGRDPREVRLIDTAGGVVAYVTVVLDAATPLADAHACGGEVRRRARREVEGLDDVFVHTEP